MARQSPEQSLPPYRGPKNVSRRQKLNTQAREAGYKNYNDWLKARREANVPKTRQTTKPVKRAYKQRTGAHRREYYYHFTSYEDMVEKLYSLQKQHPKDSYLLTARGRVRMAELETPKLRDMIQKRKVSINKVYHTLITFTKLRKQDIPRFLEEANTESRRFFEKVTEYELVRGVDKLDWTSR